MAVKERLIEYIKFKGMSSREFCRSIGVSETYVNSMRSSIQPDKIKIIMNKYTDLSMRWLFTGEGEMIVNNTVLHPIERSTLVDIGADVFKDKLIEMFKKGEIFPAVLVEEQNRLIRKLYEQMGGLEKEIESLKILLAKNGIDPQ